jgi:hypothetical protein
MGAKQARPVRGMMPGYEQGLMAPTPGMMGGAGMLGNPGIMNAPMMGAPTMLAQPPLLTQAPMMSSPAIFPNFYSQPTLLPQMNVQPASSLPMIPVAIQPPIQQPCQTVPATSVEYIWPQQAPQPQQVFFSQQPPPPVPVQQADPYFSQTLSQQPCGRGSMTPCAWQTTPQSQPTKVKVLNYPPMPRV